MSTLARFAPQLHFVPPSSAALNSLSTTNKVGVLQSYSTIHGNALTVRFNNTLENTTDTSSTILPLSNSLALSACESTVLELWFSELSKPRFGMHKHDYRVPLDAVKQKIGVINTCYHSVSPFMTKERRVPFAGSAEFSSLPHRQELNFSVTLWDEFKRPLSTTMWTGPKGKFGGGPMGIMMSNEEVEREISKMKRIPMHDELKIDYEDKNTNSKSSNLSDEQKKKANLNKENSDKNSNGITLFNELFSASIPQSDLSSMKKTKNGGYSVLMKGILPGDSNNTSENVSSSINLMTSPVHDACLSNFATHVWKDILTSFNITTPACLLNHHIEFGNEQEQEVVRIVGKTATFGALDASKPFELRSSPPLFTPQLFTKSWEHKTGLPNLRGQPCLELRIETIQHEEVVGVGTYYFTN